jgi:hypothetical protein
MLSLLKGRPISLLVRAVQGSRLLSTFLLTLPTPDEHLIAETGSNRPVASFTREFAKASLISPLDTTRGP